MIKEVLSNLFVSDGEVLYFRILLTLVLGYFILRKVLDRKKYTSYPPSASGIYVPWLGHMFAFGIGPVEFFTEQYNKLGEVFSFVLFGKDCVFMTGPEANKAFFNAPEEVLCAKEAYKFTIPCFGPGVAYDAPDSKFQQQRKMATTALTIPCFKIYVPKIEEEVERYLEEHWKGDKGEVSFEHDIGDITILTSTSCLQGPEIRAQVDTGYANYMHDIDRALSALGFFYPGLPLPTYRNRDIARRKIGAMFKAILNNRRKNNATDSPVQHTDLLQVLMESKYDDGTPVTDDEIIGNLVAFMLAGQHTSNITSSWLAIYLLSNPQLLQRVKEEQERVVGSAEHLDYELVSKMTLLGDCVKETLRLRPPIIVIWRKALQDFKYKNFIVPAGSLVCVSPAVYTKHTNSAYQNPTEFDPDRYNPDRKEDKKELYTFFPFSTGRHACIGEKFAYLQVKTVMSVILRKYDLELVGTMADYPVDNTSLLASPKGPLKIRYTRRK